MYLKFIFLFFISVGLCAPNHIMPHTVPTAPVLNGVFANGTPSINLTTLASQNRLLELSRFGLRGYDLAQHLLTQQNAVSKLLGMFYSNIYACIQDSRVLNKTHPECVNYSPVDWWLWYTYMYMATNNYICI